MAVGVPGVVRDDCSSAPLARARVTTLGLKPLLVGSSDTTGWFALSGRVRTTFALLAIKGPAGYVETTPPVALADTSMVIDTRAVTASDLATPLHLARRPSPTAAVVTFDIVEAAGWRSKRFP